MKKSNSKITFTKNQHIIPKFYLSRFADRDNTLQIYDKQWKKIGPAKKPAGFGYEFYFYAQTTGIPDSLSQSVERYLKNYEDYIAPQYDKICEKILSCNSLSEKDLYTISLMAANFMLRGYKLRDEIKYLSIQIRKHLIGFWFAHPEAKKQIYKYLGIKEKRELTKQEVEAAIKYLKEKKINIPSDNLTHIDMLEEHRGFSNMLFAKKFRFYIASGKRRFITGDVPVLNLLPKYVTPRFSVYGYSFIEQLHVLPISSKIILEFHDPTVLSGKKVIRNRVDDNDVASINARQFAGSKFRCCGCQKEDFYVRKGMIGYSLPVAFRESKWNESFIGLRVG